MPSKVQTTLFEMAIQKNNSSPAKVNLKALLT